MERLEEELLEGEVPSDTLRRIQVLRRAMLAMRRATRPLHEAVGTLRHLPSSHLDGSLQPFLRDVHDHTSQLSDMIDTYREMLMGTVDLYHHGLSKKLNDVMKLLTVISTVFIPLSFIAGLYGMNFVNMPELQHRQGYFVVLASMGAIAAVQLAWFRRRGWW